MKTLNTWQLQTTPLQEVDGHISAPNFRMGEKHKPIGTMIEWPSEEGRCGNLMKEQALTYIRRGEK